MKSHTERNPSSRAAKEAHRQLVEDESRFFQAENIQQDLIDKSTQMKRSMLQKRIYAHMVALKMEVNKLYANKYALYIQL